MDEKQQRSLRHLRRRQRIVIRFQSSRTRFEMRR